jgi:hypothetical protein
MARDWKARSTPGKTSITEAARRYHATALALAQSLGVSLAEVLTQHRESVTAIYIECSRCEVRLPASIKLPPLAGEVDAPTRMMKSTEPAARLASEELPEGSPNGHALPPATIPQGLPCAGMLLVDLKPAQLSLLIGKLAHLAEVNGGAWITLLQALRDERAARLAKGRQRPVLTPVPTDDIPG